MSDRHLTVAELSDRLSVPAKTIYEWNSKGTGPRYFKAGVHVRYPLRWVEAWENAHARGGERAS